MEKRFTPGPWRVANCDVRPTKDDTGARFLEVRAGEESRSPYGESVAGYIDCGGRTICMVQFEPREADARLIAAAPDLYEALKLAKSHIEHMAAWITAHPAGYSFEALGEDMPTITAALAKVTA